MDQKPRKRPRIIATYEEDGNQLKADRGQFVFSVFVNILSVANSCTEVK